MNSEHAEDIARRDVLIKTLDNLGYSEWPVLFRDLAAIIVHEAPAYDEREHKILNRMQDLLAKLEDVATELYSG